MNPAVVMFSKWPQPGSSKTRLCTHVTPFQAADLQAAFVQDLARMLSAQSALTPYIAYSPACPEAERYFSALLPGGRVFPQEGTDLGARMLAAIHRLGARGHTPVLVIGSDLPTLQPEVLAASTELLMDKDLVIGPSTDGGYWLIGMKRPNPELFTGIRWSTDTVLADTIRQARSAGLRTAMLQPDTDIDTWPDLLRLHGVLQSPPPGWNWTPDRTAEVAAHLVAGVVRVQ